MAEAKSVSESTAALGFGKETQLEERKIEDFIKVGKHVKVEYLDVFDDHVQIGYSVDAKYRFVTKVFYPAGELAALKAKVDEHTHRRIFCHIALVECFKFLVTFPETLDINVIADGLGAESLEFFRQVAGRAWSQHLYQNGVTGYWAPKMVYEGKLGGNKAYVLPQDKKDGERFLGSNGGGKDSFLVMKIMERAGLDFGIFQHARSEYGKLEFQHTVQDKVFKHIPTLAKDRVHRISVIDDYTDGTFVSRANPDLKGDSTFGNPCQVGWPEMVFEAIPFIINHNYHYFTLGNERSADSVQAQWDKLDDREVNHQWLKSFQAQDILSKFLRENMIQDFHVFSMLKPLYDYRIYEDLKPYPEILSSIHSCNLIKPWCKECSKCAYVWANLCARFGPAKLQPIFNENLFDKPELQLYWRELMGLEAHNAWECVGETHETRLAMKRCLEDHRMTGQALEVFKAEVLAKGPIDWDSLLVRFDKVHEENIGIPPHIFDKVKPFM